MKKLKRIPYFTHFLFILMIITLFGIIYVSFKDFMMSPAEQFETAQIAEREGALQKAERYYLMVANDSDPNVSKIASYYLGRLYRNGGEGFPINGRRAEMFLEQAALKGLPQAQYELAVLYDVGDKVPENRERAIHWMSVAAQQGYSNALYGLGVWIERGYLGKPNMNRVVSLYEQAALQNHIYAMTSLIALYSGGFSDFPSNPEKAVYWMNKLTELNRARK